MRNRCWALPLMVMTALMAAPSGVSGATTIGSDLAPDPDAGDACVPPTAACTVAILQLPGQQVASPVNGVVVRWRLRANPSTVQVNVAFRVIRPGAGGVYTGISTGTAQLLSGGLATHVFPTKQAIAAGDLIGLDVSPTAGNSSGNFLIANSTDLGVTSRAGWLPPLGNGESNDPDVTGPSELLLNADVEPDCDNDGFGDETQDLDISACNAVAAPVVVPPAMIAPLSTEPTGKRAAALKRCRKKFSKGSMKRKACIRKAKKLPV